MYEKMSLCNAFPNMNLKRAIPPVAVFFLTFYDLEAWLTL